MLSLLFAETAAPNTPKKRKEPCEKWALRPLAQKQRNDKPSAAPAAPRKCKEPCEKRAPRPVAQQTKTPSKKPVAPKKRRSKAPEPDVGSVHETDAEHRQQHCGQPGVEHCCRCNYILHKAELAREHPWCTPRPSFTGGPWRLGCDVCRWKSSVQGKEKHTGRRGCETRDGPFACHKFVHTGPYFEMEKGSNNTPHTRDTKLLQ